MDSSHQEGCSETPYANSKTGMCFWVFPPHTHICTLALTLPLPQPKLLGDRIQGSLLLE